MLCLKPIPPFHLDVAILDESGQVTNIFAAISTVIPCCASTKLALVVKGSLMELVIVEKNGQSQSIKPDQSLPPVGSAPFEEVMSLSPDFSQNHIQALQSTVTAYNSGFLKMAHEITARVFGESQDVSHGP